MDKAMMRILLLLLLPASALCQPMAQRVAVIQTDLSTKVVAWYRAYPDTADCVLYLDVLEPITICRVMPGRPAKYEHVTNEPAPLLREVIAAGVLEHARGTGIVKQFSTCAIPVRVAVTFER